MIDTAPESAQYKITDQGGWYILWTREWEGSRIWKELESAYAVNELERVMQQDIEFRSKLRTRDNLSVYYNKNGESII
jgi:hypothetical protein